MRNRWKNGIFARKTTPNKRNTPRLEITSIVSNGKISCMITPICSSIIHTAYFSIFNINYLCILKNDEYFSITENEDVYA